ncbi:unnamed protein product, partial [Hapterophycus canaliculatus]
VHEHICLTQVVIGGCHSLMDVDGVLNGDPLEVSALEGIHWNWNSSSHIARSGKEAVASKNETESVDFDGDGGKESEAVVANGAEGEEEAKEGKVEPDDVSVCVWRRYAFSSQLQRMSVIAEVSGSD